MIYELRMYTTKPGKMKHVVNASATVAQKIRNGDTYGKLIGHWWSEIGKMNQYVHMWEYQNVEEMRRLRSELSSRDDWKKEFVPLVGPYILSQEIRLLRSVSDLKTPSNSNNFYELKIINLNIGKVGQWVSEFNDLVNEIRDLDIVLETCPTSNIATKIYKSYEDHPVKKLYDQGLKITVNSDDPPFFNASIDGEYKVMSQLGLSDEELLSLTKNAIHYSFCEKETKNQLLNKLK